MSLPVPSTTTFPSMDPRQLQAMDAPLIALTQQCNGDLRQLLFAFFSFLNRRTDFYLVPHPDDLDQGQARMGFREGDAEKLLLASFRQFPLRRIPKGAPSTAAAPGTSAKGATSQPSSSSSSSSTAAETTKRVNSNKSSTSKTKESPIKTDSATPPSSGDYNVDDDKTVDKTASTNTANDIEATTTTPTTSPKADGKKTLIPNGVGNMDGVEYTEDGLQIPVGNGGSTPQYKWTQTLEETTVLIGIPEQLRAKDLDVKITSSSLSVKSKHPLSASKSSSSSSSSSSTHTFVDGELFANVRPDESTWTVEGGVMILTLDKYQKKFWPNVLVGDEQIDTEQVDSRRRISDYDEITQAQIRKTIFDQNQYHLNLPSSDEILNKKPQPAILDTASSDPIPPLPPGVEFINKKKLDEVSSSSNSGSK